MGPQIGVKLACGTTDTPTVKAFREKLRCRLLTSERGSLLVEAMFSAAVVVMAFAATTLAFNASNSSATRDINKSGALTVAQGQLEYLRSVGQADINKLVGSANVAGINGTSRAIKYGGVTYTVSYEARYVDAMGGESSDSCGSYTTSGSTGAQFIFIKVSVTYPAPGSTAPPVTLDSFFAPEGGSSQSNTGTLKVYVLGADGAPIVSAPTPTTVNLKLGNATVDSKTLNANGCVLFAGLARGLYTISVPDSTLQDLYMNSGGDTYTRQVSMPARGAIVQKVQLAQPITITPTFKSYTNASASNTITPASANPLVRDTTGANPTVGMWVGMNTSITDAGYTDYTLNPGKVFMPHYQPNPAAMASQLYPDSAGYLAYAGSCDVNNPGDENLAAVVGPSWTAPELWLTRLAQTASVTGSTTQPSANSSTTYYWNQKFSSANVKVRLVGDNTGTSPAESDCGPRALYDTWVSIGTIGTNGGALTEQLQALPTGEYDVCVETNYTYSKGTGSWFFGWSMKSISHNNPDTEYESFSSVVLPYKVAPVARTSTLNSPTPNSTTACG